MAIPKDSDLTVNQYLSRKDVDIKRKLKKSMELPERIPEVFQKSELSIGDQITYLFLNRILLDGRLMLANKFRHISEVPIVTEPTVDSSYNSFKILLSDMGWHQTNISITSTSRTNTMYIDMNDLLSTTSRSSIDDFISYSVIESDELNEIRINMTDGYIGHSGFDQQTIYYQLNCTSSVNHPTIALTPSSEKPNREMYKKMDKVCEHLFETEYKPGENYGRYYSNGKYLPIPWIDRTIDLLRKIKSRRLPWNADLNIGDDVCKGYLHRKRYYRDTNFYSLLYPEEDSNNKLPWNTRIKDMNYMDFEMNRLKRQCGRREDTLHGNLTHRSYGIKRETLKDDRMKKFINNFAKVPWYPDTLQIFDIRNRIQSPDDDSDATLISTINQDIIELNSFISN